MNQQSRDEIQQRMRELEVKILNRTETEEEAEEYFTLKDQLMDRDK